MASPLYRTLLLPLASLAMACAHSSAPSAARESQAPVVVTGSRLPQRVDLGSGLPATTSPVRVYTQADLNRTGIADVDLGRALRDLDPSTK